MAPANVEFVKADVLQKMAAAGQLAVSVVEEGGSTAAVTVEAMTVMAMAGEAVACVAAKSGYGLLRLTACQVCYEKWHGTVEHG